MVSRLGPGGWSTSAAVSLGLIAVVMLGIFVWVEHHAENPIMPIDLMLHRAIGPSLLGSMLMGVGTLSIDTFVPLYVQGGQGGGAGASASVVTPVMLTWAISGIIAAPLVVRWGFRRVAILGASLGILSFAGLLVCCYFNLPRWVLIGSLAFTGLGYGPASMSYLLSAQNAVTWRQRGLVTSGIQFFRTMGGAVGIGLFGALFNIIAQPQLKTLESHGISAASLLDPHTREHISPDLLAQAGKMISGGLWWVFVAMFLSALAGVAVATLLSRQKADHKVSALEAAEAMAG